LTQVLVDSTNTITNTYLYGVMRIGELQAGGFVYHLPDALGSVRQLANASGSVTLAKSYEPYGNVLSSAGSGSSVFAFTGEQYDASTNLLYLRARYYSGAQGRFLTADTWPSDYQQPLSLNKWLYVNGNPINATDPSGHAPFYCYDMGRKELTPNPDFKPCAQGVTSNLHRAAIRQKINQLQRAAPGYTLWVEIDRGWAFSAYTTLDLSTITPQGRMCGIYDYGEGRMECLPSNWLDSGGDDDVQTQGSGRLPADYFGGRVVRYCEGCQTPQGQAFTYSINRDRYTYGGRASRRLDDLVFQSVAAPDQGVCAFSDQALLFAPDLLSVNGDGLLSVEDSGKLIDCDRGRLDVYVGVRSYDGAIAQTNLWGGSNKPHAIWVLVSTTLPNGFDIEEYAALCPSDPISPVYMKTGAGLIVR